MLSSLSTAFLLSLLRFWFAAAFQKYDSEFARFAFEHAAAAYSKDPLRCVGKYFGTSILRQGSVSCDHFHDECLYYISKSPTYIVVAFGGTHSKLQLTAEILAGMAEPKMNNTRPILFTGHSLGGALASLASSHFAYFTPRSDIRLVTFGQPRTGNRGYALAHDILVPKSFRIVHRGDLVPHLPVCLIDVRTFSCAPQFGFAPYHHGLEVWYPQNMTETSPYELCLDEPKDEDRTCSDGYYRYNIHDHLFYFGEHVSNYGIAGCKKN
uniref:Fungal lipase-like domain-containing protein n=1 Tax=Setaria digitata TaxID=48799 RepID=A0A915PMH3_9BILA